MSISKGASSFATLLRQSKFIALGDFRNSTVVGTVFHTTDNDLYVDFGMKFHAVVKKPREESRLFVRGATVQLKLLDYELSDRFVGSDHETSLLESDAILLGLESTPVGKRGKQE